MFKLDLEKAEEPEIKLPTLLDLRKCKRIPEKHLFLELSCFFDDPADVSNLNSGSSDLSKSSWNIWKFSVHILLKSRLENFEHYFASI